MKNLLLSKKLKNNLIFYLNKISFQKIYYALPIIFQNIACSLYGLKIKNQRYHEYFKKIFIEKKNDFNLEINHIEKRRNYKLRNIFKAAYYTDFWKEKFDEHDVDIFAKDLIEELKKIPITNKEEIKKNIERISLNEKYLKEFTFLPLKVAHTSGTTGSGLVFNETSESETEKWATWWRYRYFNGINSKMWCGVFGGRSIVPPSQNFPPYWRINYPGRQILFSTFHISNQNIEHYLYEIKKRNIKWLHGYPSALNLIADYIITNNIEELVDIEIITTGAENLFEFQRYKIENAFKCKVKDHYGQAEGVANFSQIDGSKYLVDEDFSIVEFVPSNISESYKIIGTNLTNFAFPLIRYDTGDLAKIYKFANNYNHNNWRYVDSIYGRDEDYLVMNDGCKIGRLDHLFKDIIEINEAQFVQEEIGSATLKIVVNNNFNDASLLKLNQEIENRIGNRINIKIQFSKKLKRSKAGKIRLVISSIGNNNF